jgi:hypothetical protein
LTQHAVERAWRVSVGDVTDKIEHAGCVMRERIRPCLVPQTGICISARVVEAEQAILEPRPCKPRSCDNGSQPVVRGNGRRDFPLAAPRRAYRTLTQTLNSLLGVFHRCDEQLDLHPSYRRMVRKLYGKSLMAQSVTESPCNTLRGSVS